MTVSAHNTPKVKAAPPSSPLHPAAQPPTARRMSKGRIGAVIAALAVSVGALLLIVRHNRPEAPKYETVLVERGSLQAKITATGTLSALVTVTVGSQVSGRIQALFADFNSPVKKGQKIAQIDPQLFQAAVENARANLAAAKGQLDVAKAKALDAHRQFTRSKEMSERKLIAQADLDTAESNSLAADAQVESNAGNLQQAQAQLHQAVVNLDYTNIISPINGVIISRAVDVGQTVAATMTAPTIFTIAEDPAKMQVDSSVTEADVGKLQPGMKAFFTVDAYPGEKFVGTIRQIRNAATIVQNVVTYDAVIDVDNKELKLKPGMTANVTVIYAERAEVLKLSNAALRFHPPRDFDNTDKPSDKTGGDAKKKERQPDDTRRTVYVVRGEKMERAKIKTGLSDGTASEVLEGDLVEGDKLVTEILDDKSAGAPRNGAAAGGGGQRGGPRMPF